MDETQAQMQMQMQMQMQRDIYGRIYPVPSTASAEEVACSGQVS